MRGCVPAARVPPWAGQGWGVGSSLPGSSGCLPKIPLGNQGLMKGMVRQAELYSLNAMGGRQVFLLIHFPVLQDHAW